MSTETDYQMPWRKEKKQKKNKTKKFQWNDQKEFVNYDTKRAKGLGKGGCSAKMKYRQRYSTGRTK